MAVVMRAPAHEAGGGPADIRAVEEKNLVICRRMFTSKLEAMSGSTVTNVGALVALSSALLEIGAVQLMRHVWAP